MKRYWFTLMDAEYNDLGALIPDGSSKQTAVNEYLDTWCGSVEEENAFIKAGVEPY